MVLSPPKTRAGGAGPGGADARGGIRGGGAANVRRQATETSNIGPCALVGDASFREAICIHEAEASARDYSAPWKLDHISDSVISGLLYQVNRHLGGTATALQDISTTPGRRPAATKEDWSSVPLIQRVSQPVMKWENEQALEQLRVRLLSRFPTLTSVFRGIDHNKDATLTFGELSAGLQKLGFRGLVPKELRMAFGAMDIEGKGFLSLGDWVHGTAEDELFAVPEKPTARQVHRPCVPIHERPAWSNRQVPVSVSKSTTFERHLDEHPLPPPPPPPPRTTPEQLSPAHPEAAHFSVLARSEDHLQRRAERLEAKRAEEDLAVAKQKAARPKISPKSQALAQDAHVKPWKDRPQDLAKTQPIYKKRVHADLTERQEQVAKAHTFRPQLSPKSHAMFDQFEDNGKPWHERLYGRHERLAAMRSGSPNTCRMALLRKKMTKDFLADHFRERRPQLSPASRRRVRSAEGGRRPGIDVHSRLHMNLVRGKTCHSDGEEDDDDDSFVLTGHKASRSVSFLYRPGPRAPVPHLNIFGAKDGSTGPAGAGAQGEATITTAGGLPSDSSGSPVGGSRGGGEWSDASMLAGSPAGGMQQAIQSLEATIKPTSGPCARMVASPDITALLSAIAPYARPMGGDSDDDDDDEEAH